MTGLLFFGSVVAEISAAPGTEDPALRASVADAVTDDPGDAIVGDWATEPGVNQAFVRIVRDGDRYAGTIVGLKEPLFQNSEGGARVGEPKTDLRNPDPAQRGRPIIGVGLLNGFRHQGNRQWSGGTIYDPESGKTYKCKLKLTDDAQTLDVRGYIGISALGRTTVWTRAPQPGGTP